MWRRWSRLKISPTSAGLATLALLLAGAGVAATAQDKPESLLPPGFDQPAAPAPAPAPARPAQQGPAPQSPAIPLPSTAPVGVPGEIVQPIPFGNDIEIANTAAPEQPIDLSKYELPDWAKRSLHQVGPATPASLGLPHDAFGRADGRFLETLMRRLDAPIASRWLSIALRRALLSRVDTPKRVNGADFAAERAWLLLRMGEAVAARAVVQSVDITNYTPKLYQVAMQADLATADPAGICGMVPGALQVLKERSWVLAEAMCAGLAGKPNEAGRLIDQARRQNVASGVDMLLAEKVLGTGAQGRRAVTIEWPGVDSLTTWRFGLASATGEEIPDELFGTVGPQARYWRTLLPGPDPKTRAADAELAAAQGIFSHRALADLYGEIDEENDSGTEVGVARNLRSAFTEPDTEGRLSALKDLWNQPNSPRARYGRLVLTARAATVIPVEGTVPGEDQDKLVASMVSAGLVPQAMAWNGRVARGSLARVLLALADSEHRRVPGGEIDAFRQNATPRQAQMLLAGLAGLGRLSEGDSESYARSLDVALGGENPWTWAIDAAARRGEAGTVVLLAGVGMQTRAWEGVSPEAVFHIVGALRAVGLEGYARMIAAEAVTRL